MFIGLRGVSPIVAWLIHRAYGSDANPPSDQAHFAAGNGTPPNEAPTGTRQRHRTQRPGTLTMRCSSSRSYRGFATFAERAGLCAPTQRVALRFGRNLERTFSNGSAADCVEGPSKRTEAHSVLLSRKVSAL